MGAHAERRRSVGMRRLMREREHDLKGRTRLDKLMGMRYVSVRKGMR
jgi:hypothetical protein